MNTFSSTDRSEWHLNQFRCLSRRRGFFGSHPLSHSCSDSSSSALLPLRWGHDDALQPMTFMAWRSGAEWTEDGRNSHVDAIRDKHNGRDYRPRSHRRRRRPAHFLPPLVLSGEAANYLVVRRVYEAWPTTVEGVRGRGRLHAALFGP